MLCAIRRQCNYLHGFRKFHDSRVYVTGLDPDFYPGYLKQQQQFTAENFFLKAVCFKMSLPLFLAGFTI